LLGDRTALDPLGGSGWSVPPAPAAKQARGLPTGRPAKLPDDEV
jgi:hypothetical protein